MKNSIRIAALILLTSLWFTAHAAQFGRLPATPGGSDWQAYYDDQLNITWATNTNINGSGPWASQLSWVSTLIIGGIDGWRLPNMDRNGDQIIINCSAVHATTCLDNEYGYMYYQNGITPASPGPFIGLQVTAYWSATDNTFDPDSAWTFDFSGGQYTSFTIDGALAWAVHDGDVALAPDIDNDGIDNHLDNCLSIANPNQQDSDNDGIGNLCDPDFNQDCAVNFADLSIMRAGFFSSDTTIDLNSDGTVNFIDLSIMRTMFFGEPGPSGLIPLCVPAPAFDLGPAPAVSIECLAESPGAGSVPIDSTADGQWLQFRRDRKLTGRSPLIGDITCPTLLWNIDLGTRTSWFSIRPDTGSLSLELPVTGEFGDRFQTGVQLFETNGIQVDLNGDQSVLLDPLGNGYHLVGDLLASVAGFERIMCAPEFGSVENRCYLHNWNNDAWQEVWHSDLSHFEANHGPRPLVGDFDNDGVVEAVVQAWYQIHMLDLATGNLEQSGTFLDPATPAANDNPTGRAYGWFGALDIDGEPKDEFVILGDFEHFIAVIGWENDALTLLWEHRIEPNNYQNFVRHHVITNPVADIDGDGLPEIATSIFNENGDEKWHVLVFDGVTGNIELDLTGAYLSGMGDLDGDQVAELLITETTGHGLPQFADTYVLSFIGQSQSVIWSGAGESFELYQSPGFADGVNARTVFYRRSVFLRDDWDAQPVFATRSRSGIGNGNGNGTDITMRFYQMSGGVLTESASMTGPRLQILSLPHTAPERGILVQSITENAQQGPVSMTNLSATLEVAGRTHPFEARPMTKVARSFQTFAAVARLAPSGPVAVVTQDNLERVRAFDVSSSGTPVELWRVDGRGLTSGSVGRSVASTNEFRSVVLADVDGGGDLEVVMADQTESGDGLIKAVDSDGGTVWESQLPTPGAPPVFNDGGITHWVAGNFRTPDTEDILVSVRRQSVHNHQLHLLDGLTGQLVWTNTDGGPTDCFAAPIVGPGDALMPVFDWDNDGLDEALNVGSNVFAVYDGSDGALLIHRPTLSGNVCLELNPIQGIEADNPPITPIIDFLNNGSEQVLFGKRDSTLGVLALNGDPAWLTTPYSGMPNQTLEGVADLDGDSDLEVIVVGHCTTPGEEVRVYDGASGALRWTMALPEACQGAAAKALSSGDLDGDGNEEVYFTQNNLLYALAEIGGNGAILWRVTFSNVGGEFSTAVIADVDGTGRPQILINTPDAYLYSLGAPSAQ